MLILVQTHKVNRGRSSGSSSVFWKTVKVLEASTCGNSIEKCSTIISMKQEVGCWLTVNRQTNGACIRNSQQQSNNKSIRDCGSNLYVGMRVVEMF